MGCLWGLFQSTIRSGNDAVGQTYDIEVQAEYECTLVVKARSEAELPEKVRAAFAKSLADRLRPEHPLLAWAYPFDDIANGMVYDYISLELIFEPEKRHIEQ